MTHGSTHDAASLHGDAPPHAAAIDRALGFLARGQLPSGQFRTDYIDTNPGTGVTTVTPDETPFATAHIALSLRHSAHPEARRLLARAIEFCHTQMLAAGVWRYANKGSAQHHVLPPDTDDTACISHLLARHGTGAPDNIPLLLLSRDRRGLFYTWIIPRPVRTANLRYWALVLRDLNLARAFLLWRRTPARRDDVDAVVNANVLLYLGERPETQPVIDYLLGIARDGREESCDKWYHDRHVFYYALARNYMEGIRRLAEVRSTMHDRLAATAHPDGRLGEHALHTALAACALLGFGHTASPLLDGAIAYLRRTQEADGGWPSAAFYHAGHGTGVAWGSRELTTGFCVEALERYEEARRAAAA